MGVLIQHHARRDISNQRRGCLILIGCIIEMDVGTSHLAVVFAVCASGHETIAKIYKAAQCHKGKEDGLLQANCMSRSNLLFKDAPISHMCTIRHLHTIQKKPIL